MTPKSKISVTIALAGLAAMLILGPRGSGARESAIGTSGGVDVSVRVTEEPGVRELAAVQESAGSARASVEVVDGGETDKGPSIVIPHDQHPTASARVGVRGPYGEIPVGAFVMTRPMGNVTWRTQYMKGRSERLLTPLVSGVYDLWAEAPGLAPSLGSFVAEPDKEVNLVIVELQRGAELVLDTKCSLPSVIESGDVELTVVDASGRVIIYASLSLGVERHGPLESGDYTARAWSECIVPIEVEFTIIEGEPAVVVLDIEPATLRFFEIVLAPSERRVEWVDVRLLDRDGKVLREHREEVGINWPSLEWGVASILIGPYILEATDSLGRMGRLAFEVTEVGVPDWENDIEIPVLRLH